MNRSVEQIEEVEQRPEKVQETAMKETHEMPTISVQTIPAESSRAPMVLSGPNPVDWTSRDDLLRGIENGQPQPYLAESSFRRKAYP